MYYIILFYSLYIQGDRLNFGIAASRAKLEGIKVEWVLVDDDVALLNDDNRKDNTVGERGLCGTVFIHKIAGALAQKGKSLYEIKEKLDYILRNNLLRTLGVSLTGRVQLPGETDKEVTNSNQIELGLGIHGEAGKRKMDLLKSYIND
jgi:dihydroxyacetone kinase